MMDGRPPVDIVALRSEIADFLACEAQAVDDRDWDTWLDLHEETVEYWVPAWDSEYETTSDPQTEMSLSTTTAAPDSRTAYSVCAPGARRRPRRCRGPATW